jgi:hypothetical protein
MMLSARRDNGTVVARPDHTLRMVKDMPYKDPEQKRAYDKIRYAANRGKVKAQSRAWYLANAERKAATVALWRAANPEWHAANSVRWKAANPARTAANIARWAATNPDKRALNQARRRAARLLATPAWANQDLIYSFYRMAEVFGLEVDHIIPLTSKKVCGLHCEHNLQLLTTAENVRKGNRF